MKPGSVLAEAEGEADGTSLLIVDDEDAIRKTLGDVCRDEGFMVLEAAEGDSALRVLAARKIDLVLLDIWMPGKDGLEVLTIIKEKWPSIPVVMISGHATIATAIKATRLGALDFIEKPLDLEVTLHTIRRALGRPVEELPAPATANDEDSPQPLALVWPTGSHEVNPVVFKDQRLRSRSYPQKTLAQSAVLYGQGLHSGRKSGLILEPLPPNSGIHFVGVSETSVVPAHVDYVGTTGFATTIRFGRTQAGTIEHLMSALHAYGVSNLLVKCNGEVPVMDGSAREFCRLFEEVGLEEQPGDWYSIRLDKPLEFSHGKEWVRYEPADGFTVDYFLEYPAPIGTQRMTFVLDDVESYKREIAPSRTFGFVRDIGALQKQGLALGGRFDNFVLLGEDGVINTELRFPDEPVRHKILDAIGDLYLLGRRIEGKITAHMTGHSDNIALLKLVRDEMRKAV